MDDSGDSASGLTPPGEPSASTLPRDTNPDVSDETLAALTEGDRAFATALYHQLTEPGENLFFSPHSVSVALAMTLAGASGDTASQMLSAMQLSLSEPDVHPAMNALALALEQREQLPEDVTGDGFRLSIVNQTWGQTGYTFGEDFLDTLAVNYGAGLYGLDFHSDPETCRAQINDWVTAVTEGRIEELLGQGTITIDTRLVLVNAIYFKASWSAPFDASHTTDESFTLGDDSEVSVPMMHGTLETSYSSGDGWSMVEVPYIGEKLDMTLIVPDAGRFDEVEAELDQPFLDAALDDVTWGSVDLSMPRFELATQAKLNDPLQALGMVDAFDPTQADFTRMSATGELYVSAVVHKAVVTVDETGTEAAAATAVIEAGGGMPEEPVTVTADRPFLFVIRDRPTGAILFMGRVMDPRG